MNPANRREAIDEVILDIKEGADLVMVKPSAYLDILRDVHNAIDLPYVYQVGGEYAMLRAAAEKGWLYYNSVMMEQLIAFKRAGASIIASYSARMLSICWISTICNLNLFLYFRRY